MSGASRKSSEPFGKLCGDEAIMTVTFATTKWQRATNEEGVLRENELKGKSCNSMLDHGATLVLFEETKESALAITDKLVEKAPIDALLIQEGPVDLQRRLPEILAAQILRIALRDATERLRNKGDGDEEAAQLLELGHAQLTNSRSLLVASCESFFVQDSSRGQSHYASGLVIESSLAAASRCGPMSIKSITT
jgi:hypothetical protein